MAGLTQAEKLMRVGVPGEVAKHFAGMVGSRSDLQGTFTLNGATNVVVANVNLAADDQIIFTLVTVGGTVGAAPNVKTRTNGTGFAVAGTAGDTSVYQYRIMRA